MVDLTQQGSLEYWKNFPDPVIFQVISLMESTEHWVYDSDDKLEQHLSQLGQAMEDITRFDLKQEQNFIDVGNCLHMSRVLRLMQGVDRLHPGSASRLLMYTEENAASDANANFFLQRNIAFERLRLLSRVFANERLELIQNALDQEDL